jgi:multisubunit Na+/H+ antiporter MnhB subunit
MMKEQEGMTIIVKIGARLLCGFLMMYGIYIILHGHLTPGGGFPGGVIIAGSFVLYLLAFGGTQGYARIRKHLLSVFEGFGGIMFASIALLGFTGGMFFRNFLGKGEPFALFSSGIIPFCNIAIGIKVACGLFTMFIAFLLLSDSPETKE